MKYYLYRHIRLDKNIPFYIGVATKPKWYSTFRTEYPRAFAKNGRNDYWKRIVSKTEYEVEILYEANSKIEILNKEIEFVSLYGRHDTGSGTLSNLTNGGESFAIFSEELLKKLNEHKRSKYEEKFGIDRSKDIRHKMSLSMKGKNTQPRSEQARINMSKALKGRVSPNKGISMSEETKKRISVSKQGQKSWNTGLSGCFSSDTKSKMSIKKSIPVVQLSMNGELVRFWDSSQLVKKTIKGTGSLAQCLKGKYKSSGGFKWVYKKDYAA